MSNSSLLPLSRQTNVSHRQGGGGKTGSGSLEPCSVKICRDVWNEVPLRVNRRAERTTATCDLLGFDSIKGLDVYNQPAATESDNDDGTKKKTKKKHKDERRGKSACVLMFCRVGASRCTRPPAHQRNKHVQTAAAPLTAAQHFEASSKEAPPFLLFLLFYLIVQHTK